MGGWGPQNAENWRPEFSPGVHTSQDKKKIQSVSEVAGCFVLRGSQPVKSLVYPVLNGASSK